METQELLRLEGVKKSFGSVEVLRGLNISARQGEFVTLLGSSGCGKTTTLRIIAGLETADEGRVFIEGRDVSELEPNKRGVNMVFQNYALFPHMNVEQNTGYSLKLKGLPKDEIRQAVAEALALVQLDGYEKRMPHELSGGQRQRVAVARAVINKPKALLLDEPLGALDLQLRRQMQIELKRLQKRLGITFIYITHDQEEALTMSDRIAVMRNGLFEQIGPAADVYKTPKTCFVARFVGSANVLSGKVSSCTQLGSGSDKKTLLGFEHFSGSAALAIPASAGEKPVSPGMEINVAVREENVIILPEKATDKPFAGGRGLAAVVTGINFTGGLLRITVRLKNSDGTESVGGAESGVVAEGGDVARVEEICGSHTGIDCPIDIGDEVRVDWLPENAVMVDP